MAFLATCTLSECRMLRISNLAMRQRFKKVVVLPFGQCIGSLDCLRREWLLSRYQIEEGNSTAFFLLAKTVRGLSGELRTYSLQMQYKKTGVEGFQVKIVIRKIVFE